ncbi:MAG: hypothetical protein WCL34_12285 [Methylococcaceae bacterium]
MKEMNSMATQSIIDRLKSKKDFGDDKAVSLYKIGNQCYFKAQYTSGFTVVNKYWELDNCNFLDPKNEDAFKAKAKEILQNIIDEHF